MEISRETLEFIKTHAGASPAELRLRYSKAVLPGVDIPFALNQIEARRKASGKLGGILGTYPEFVFPDTLSAEQCTAERVASLHAEIAGRQDDVLDLTCGLGIDAMALAGVARRVRSCDIDPTHVECAVHNARVRGIDNFEAVRVEAGEYLQFGDDATYSLVFADPARRSVTNKRTFALEDCSPDILTLLPHIRRRTTRLLIKVSPMLDVSMLTRQLPEVTDIYAVSLRGECKELLADCRFDIRQQGVRYHAVDIRVDGKVSRYSFTSEAESLYTTAVIESEADVCAGKYLFEPNASLMKFISKASLAKDFPTMRKAGVNTHLYISDDELPADMPGRVLRIEAVISPSKKAKSMLPDKANVVTRNYVESADRLKARFRLKDGGDKFVYACRVCDSIPRLLICEPITGV